jgi:hypothetical protein
MVVVLADRESLSHEHVVRFASQHLARYALEGSRAHRRGLDLLLVGDVLLHDEVHEALVLR